MPDLATGRHRLPLLAVSQALKEVTHNEALVLIDALLHTEIENIVSLAPVPTDNDIGKCWLVGPAPSGLWATKSGHIAIWVGGSWRFVAPQSGMRVWNKTQSRQILYVAGQWINAPAISAPTGGTVVDTQARAILSELLQILRSIGILAT